MVEELIPNFDALPPPRIRDDCPFVFLTASEVEYLCEKYNLTEIEKIVLFSVSIDGMSQREAARALSKSRRSIRATLRRIRIKVFDA